MIPALPARSEPSCHGNRRLSRAVELSVRGTELLGESNALLRRIAEISQRTTEANRQYALLLLDWSARHSGQHPLQVPRDRRASHDASLRIARRATRAALDIGVLADGVAPAWRRGINGAELRVTNLNDLALRIAAVTAQVERIARRPAARGQELAALAAAMRSMRDIARQNIQVARRSAAGVESILHEALRFARRLSAV